MTSMEGTICIKHYFGWTLGFRMRNPIDCFPGTKYEATGGDLRRKRLVATGSDDDTLAARGQDGRDH
ncbi:hypothetical protein Q3G72_016049 [Acer saccharum]|nr:hypothetical protein Q3G72_016049 [Acer saccharum]